MENIEDTDSFEKTVEHYIRIHRELHGKNFRWEDVAKDYIVSFPEEDIYTVYDEIERQEKQKIKNDKSYGLFIGRCQPFTNGHNAIIQKIIRNGKIPIMILGSSNQKNDKNPLSFSDRVTVIRKIYPFGVQFIKMDDYSNWDEWYSKVTESLYTRGITKEQVTLYAHNKEVDNKNFKHNGKQYREASYTEIFKDDGFEIKAIDEVLDGKEVIHASDIRKDERIAKRNLDARVYRFLKDKMRWW